MPHHVTQLSTRKEVSLGKIHWSHTTKETVTHQVALFKALLRIILLDFCVWTDLGGNSLSTTWWRHSSDCDKTGNSRLVDFVVISETEFIHSTCVLLLKADGE